MRYEDIVTNENVCFENSNVTTYTKKKKRKINKTLMLTFFCFVVLLVLQFVNTGFTNELLRTINSITQVGKPTAELFDEEANVFFVSFFNSISLGNKLPGEFQLPIVYKSIDTNGDVIKLVAANNVVVSGYDGQVKKIAIEDGKKIVFIEHSGGLVSKYENLEYVGVISGQIIKQGMTIGSIKQGDELKLSFMIRNNPVNFEIVNDKVRFVV